MSRYLGPRLRIVRRLGYLVGLTRKKPSTRLLNPDARRGIRKVLPPGQHGRSKSFKKNPYESNEYDFLIRLKLKQRIRYHYGINEKQLVNYVRQARKIKGSTGRVLLRLLEMRLDNTIFRLHMAPTIRAARQLITHGHIYVNNKKVSIPSYSCKPKDIITPAPKTRSIQLLNNFLTELDLEKSRFRNLLKILKFGKKGLLNNPKILNNNKNITNQKDCKPNTIISLRIQRAGASEGQGIGFLGRNLVIVQPLFGNIKNYLGKSINICIYLKRENIFYGYPTKPFNVKMRYSKLINSIDAIQYFGRKKINSIKSIETDIKKNSNKPSSAIILMGGANILRNKLNKKNANFRQNSSDNILVRIEAASCGKNSKSVLNRKRQLNPFLLNKTRDTNPILFREKYLYSRKNQRFIGINHIFYVKMILKSVEQNSNNLVLLEQKQPLKNKLRTSINNSLKDNLLYSKLNKSSLNSFKLGELNTDLSVSKKNSNFTLINPMALENSLKLKKYYLSKLKTSNLFIETKLSFISWCIQKEKSEINVTKSKLTTSPSSINFNKKILKQKLFKNLLSQTVIKKNLNINFFWKAIYLFSKINLAKIDDSQKNIVFKTNFLQKFCKMIFEQKIDFSNKKSLFSTKTFLFFSKTFSLINEWKSKILINNTLFDQFLYDIKESISLLILLQKSIVSLLRNKKQFSNFNIKSSLILEYYKNQEFEILRNLQLQIINQLTVQKFEKLSLNKINKINQFRKIFEVNSIKKEFNFYQSLICNNKLLDFNISDKIDVLTNLNYFLKNKRFINYFSIYENSLKNNKNLLKKHLSKYKFEVQLFLNFFKKTTIFLNSFDSSKLNLFKETENLMKENLFKKQVLQKLNFIKIDLSLKKYLVINILNKLINFNVISDDQKQQILFQINNSLSLENGKKYKNILSKVTNNNELFDKEDYQLILNKIKNKIFNEKISENLFRQQLDNIKNLQKIGNFDLIFNSDKIDIINRTTNKINLILKLIHFEKNTLLRNTISNNLKKKILIETSINIKKKIYLTKLIYFQKTASLNFETIFEKIQKHIIEQKIKQKKELLLISEKYENHYIKTLPLFNMDQNGNYLINYFSQLFDMQEMQIFKKLNQMDISFYPIELNKKIIKQKVIQMTTSWSNFIVIFKKIREFYQDNEITKNQYNILRYQTKQFIIKQLILNKNQLFIGSYDYLQFSQNNINYFINQIKTNINNSELNLKKQNHSEFFDFSLIQIYQKYNQLFNLLKTNEQFFSDESIKNHLYLNRLRKMNLFDGSNLKNSNIQNYLSIYNNILKSYGLKYRKSYQKLSSNIMIKLSQNLAKWIENLSVLELKRGVSLLNKKQVITKPNSKLLISNLLQFKQNISKFINNSLSLNSVLVLKGNNIYLQKSIQSFINLLTRLNLSINYKKLNSQFNYPMNINVQNQLNKKQYYQQYNQILSSQQQNQIINNFINSFNNKLQILTELNLFDSGIKIQFQKLLGKLTNEIHELNNLNQSMDETSYKTMKLVSKTIKLCNLFIYYHLKYLKKANKQDSQKNYKEKNYLKNELLTKLFSKITILKQQNLLTIPKYETLLDQLKQQQLTKQFVVNLFNEINLSKLEQLIESKFIYSDYIFYSKVQFFKFLTNYIILKERYEIKEIKNQKLINQIRIQLNQNFQNEFQYILYISKFSKLTQNGVLTNEQKDQIDYQLINILNTMKNFSKRSIKLQERLKYGFINYRKYETITQNLVQNLQFKIQKLINNSAFSEKTKMISLSNFNFNRVKILNFNISIKKIYSLHNTCWQQLQKLMYLILNSTKDVVLNMNKVDSNTLIFNYFKKELKVIEIRNIFKNIEKNANYLQDLKNKTKTRIISQTRKYYGALTTNSKSKIFRKNDKSVNKNQIHSVSQIKKAKNQQNLLQTSKLVLLKQFLYQIKNVIYNNFNQNSSIVAKISNSQLLLIRNFNLFNLNSLENLTLQTNPVENYLNKLEVSIQLSKINNIHSKKHAFKLYQNLTYNKSNDKNPSTNLSLLSTNLDSMLLNIKINNISEILQKSYKYKILLNTQNETNKMVNSIRIEKLKASGLLSLKNTKLKTNQKIQELFHQLGDILIVSNYSNVSLISKYLKFELNLLKKSEKVEESNKYLRSKIHIISNKLSDLKNHSLIDSQKKYRQIKNLVLKTIFSQILISPNLDSLKDLIKTNLISPKLYIKIKKVFYRKKLISKLQNALFKLKQSSFNNSYEFKTIFPKLILVLEKFNDLKILNLISNNQYNLIQTQIQQILKYEQFISHLILLKKQDILKDIEYNQMLLKIQQKIVQKVREQKIVQKFKQYIEYLYETKNTSQSSQKDQQESLNNKFKKIISLNQGKWALVAIKEFYQQNLLTNIQYNELVQKIETNIRKKIQLAKLFSNNRNTFKSTIYNKFMKSNYKIRQNQQKSKLLTSLPNIWTKNLLKELRKQSIISNNTYSQLEKEVISNNYLKTNENQIDLILNQPTKTIKKYNRLKAQTIKDVELSIELLLNYKKQLLYWLSTIETTPINSDQLFDLSYLTNLKINKYINQKEYNKLKISNQLATNRLLRLKTLQKGQSLNNLQYEKINQKILKSYLLTQFQYIQRLLRTKQSILQEFDYSSKNQKLIVGKTIKKHLNKIRNSKKLIKNPNSLYSLIQEVLSQLPISNTNKGQSTYRQRIIYNRLYSRLRSDETLIKKWKQILTKVLKKQLTPPLDIPPHLELKRIQISILPTNLTKKNKKHLIIPIGTVLNLPSRKTVGISVLERLIVEYYSRN